MEEKENFSKEAPSKNSFHSQTQNQEFSATITGETQTEFRLDKLSETELSSLRETARQELSGEHYSPEKNKAIKNTVSKELLAELSQEAITRAKETSAYLKLRDAEVSREKKIEEKVPPQKKEDPLKKIQDMRLNGETTKTNLAEVVKAQNLSLAQIALAEQARKRRSEQMEVISKERSWQRIILSISILFVLLGTGVISYLAFFAGESENTPKLPQENKDYLVLPDSETYIATSGLTNKAIQGRLQEALINLEAGTNKIGNLALVKKEGPNQKDLSVEEVLTIFEISPPERLLRTLSSKYMVGMFSGETNAGFILLKVSSFESASAATREWEHGSMENISSLLSVRNVSPSQRETNWVDAFVRNIDARLLIDPTEEIFLVYSFVDKETLIIAPDKDTFIAVVDRYNTPQKVLK